MTHKPSPNHPWNRSSSRPAREGHTFDLQSEPKKQVTNMPKFTRRPTTTAPKEPNMRDSKAQEVRPLEVFLTVAVEGDMFKAMDRFAKALLNSAYAVHGGNAVRMAKALNVSRNCIYARMARHFPDGPYMNKRPKRGETRG